MRINEDKVDKVVKEMQLGQFFYSTNRFPNSFYRLTDEEKKEVVKRYRAVIEYK